MTVRKTLGTIVAAVAVAAFVSTTAMAGVAGTYKRKGGTAKVSVCKGGGLRAVASNGTVMFRCARKTGGSTWKDNQMKHPSMPGFMKFNGTVKKSGNKLHVSGCMVGGSMCQSETWTKK